MEDDESDKPGFMNLGDNSRTAVNTLILNYYKKSGRKRDLEKYFSLSTAQGEVSDPTSLFWQRMKAQTDSSDSGEKPSESSTEVCRISIKCSVPEASCSQERTKPKHESDSPPIITEEADKSEHSDNESVKSDDHSQKSLDATLDTSNKPLSPTSSVTSQRKLEWDSLADVGYPSEGDQKTSSSGLSTVERLALKQQFSNEDKDLEIGPPTAHSTMVDPEPKGKKKARVTELHSRDVNVLELNLPRSDPQPSINVNLTKHISFNVEKDGGITVEKTSKDLSVSPAKASVETEVQIPPTVHVDRQIQTSLNKSTDQKHKKSSKSSSNGAPVFISLNTLRKRIRRRRRPKRQSKKKDVPKHISAVEKSTEQVSEAESFEYMPGHMYNQGQKLGNSAGNKSSLESSGGITTESSKSNISFAQDLEKSIQLLQKILKHNQDDSNLKKQLVKDLVKKLVSSRYKDDTSTDFLSGLSLSSKRLGQGEDYKSTTSTSDANNTADKFVRPKKSILRTDKFNANALASTSQSAPNLAAVTNDAPMSSSFDNIKAVSQTESDVSSKETKSSQELYNKYLDALRREAYKKHLRNKEKLLKEKLVGSDGALRQLVQTDARSKRLRDLMKDLTRNNYNDGSGDASKLEGGSQVGQPEIDIRNKRSHSVFTLSSGNSDKKGEDDKERRKIDLRNRLEEEIKQRLSSKGRPIKHHYCCCPHHTKLPEPESVQVEIQDCIEEDMPCLTTNKSSNIQSEIIACGQYTSCVCNGRNMKHTDGTCGCKCPHHTMKILTGSSQIASAPCGHSREAASSPRFGRETCSTQMPNETPCGYSKEPATSAKYDRDAAQPSTSRARNVEVRHIGHNPCSQRTETAQKKQSQSSQTNLAVNLLKSRSNYSPCRYNKVEEERGPIDVIQESTRWAQTEISINPRIPEASLADINIINKADCAKLVSQSYREVPRPRPLEKRNDTANNTDHNKSIDETMKKRATSCYKELQRPKPDKTNDIATQSNLDINDKINSNTDSYSIPLKGTNMTLHVSVGANGNKNDNDHRREEGVNTDQVDYGDQVTSKHEECTKAVQCQTEDIFDRSQEAQTARYVDRESNTDPKSLDRNKVTFSSEPKVTNACLSGNNKFSTYPKEQKKVMIRSNTDGRLSEKCLKDPSVKISRDASVETNNQMAKPEPVLSKPRELKSPHEEREVVDNKSAKSSLNSDSSKSTKSDLSNKSNVKTSRPNSRPNSPNTKDPVMQSILDHDNTRTSFSSKSDSSKSSRSDNNKTKSSYHSVGAESSEKSKENLEPEGCKTSKKHTCGEGCDCGCGVEPTEQPKDPALEMIRDITKRYSKQDLEKGDRKKCFKEIMSVLNYLLDTDDSTDTECPKLSALTDNEAENKTAKEDPPKESQSNKIDKVTVCTKMDKIDEITVGTATSPKILVDKGIQLVPKKSRSKSVICESSDHADSSDLPTTSSDSATCKILNKIKKECEKYHNKRCKCSSKRCEGSSTTSTSCGDCKKVHHCSCRTHNVHKCKHRKPEKSKKQCVAYNLILQTSDSFVGEETCDNKRELKNIVFKVPSKRHCGTQNMPFKEMATKLEEYANSKRCPQTYYKFQRSRSLPNDSEISSTDDVLKRCPGLTVREYLEKNRPDFIENTSTRQNCLKMISESRAGERAAQRELLSMQLQRDSALNVSAGDIRRLAREVGVEIRRRKVGPKLISEREMKRRSEAIYKSLPEVVRKKDEARKESSKRTNLLMASIFKKNLQKKALRGSVNISNYSTVIKI